MSLGELAVFSVIASWRPFGLKVKTARETDRDAVHAPVLAVLRIEQVDRRPSALVDSERGALAVAADRAAADIPGYVAGHDERFTARLERFARRSC